LIQSRKTIEISDHSSDVTFEEMLVDDD